MKELYERPMITVEEFTVNRAIAACGDEVGRDVIFDCMIGPQTDTTNVLTTSCSRVAGTTSVTQALATNSFSHSNHSGGTWGTSGRSTRTYTAPSDAIGLLYFCSAGGTSCFSVENGVLTHETSHSSGGHGGGGNYHVQIAPLYGTSIEEVNVGS